MALLAVAVYDKEGSGRTETTGMFLENIRDNVDWKKHRIILVDNNSCTETKDLLFWFYDKHMGINCQIITNTENVGTAKAINQAWKLREPGENCLKIDNDIEIHHENWIEEMEEVFRRDPSIGLVGLKRKDCEERPDHPEHSLKSTLMMLPHKAGEKWVVVERAKHVMGTCHLVSSDLIDKIGGYYQPDLYGWDDCLYCLRAHLAGFKTVFLPHIQLDHLYEVEVSKVSNEYAKWKEDEATKSLEAFYKANHEYTQGIRNLYEPL